jgi:hypothetical protein
MKGDFPAYKWLGLIEHARRQAKQAVRNRNFTGFMAAQHTSLFRAVLFPAQPRAQLPEIFGVQAIRQQDKMRESAVILPAQIEHRHKRHHVRAPEHFALAPSAGT